MTAISPSTPEGPGPDLYPPAYRVVRHIVSFLKWRFSELPPGAYQWKRETENTPDQSGSEIFIGADTPIQPSIVGQRPAITVMRSAASLQGVGIGDLGFVDLRTGAQTRMDIMPTNIMVAVLTKLPVVAEQLAHFCFEQIWTFREEIVRTEPCILNIGQRPSISAPTGAGQLVASSSEFEWVAVMITFPTWLQVSTTKLPLNKKILSGFTVRATVPPAEDRPPLVTPPGASPLQGTAVWQQQLSPSNQAAAAVPLGGGGSILPQTGSDEAQSSAPLTVTIETK
jgi:hypothetical protein